ncbi:zf-HC2 domain-containing protein [Kitasatospora sp. NPDC050463]|uniref:zf-HC2 domain-containing protein n=1 Tax=Kitasatospora sp. NPDC050463 TaxID=3155786 RepID=UPI00340ADFEB
MPAPHPDGPVRGQVRDDGHMRCAHFRTALSARLDGEPTGLPDRRLDKHLARCEACRDWRERAERLRGRVAAGGADGPSAEWSATLLASLGQRGPGSAESGRGESDHGRSGSAESGTDASGSDRAGAAGPGAARPGDTGTAVDGLGATGGPGQGDGGSAPER